MKTWETMHHLIGDRTTPGHKPPPPDKTPRTKNPQAKTPRTKTPRTNFVNDKAFLP